MKAIKAYELFCNALSSNFDDKEAENISNIYFEDLFSLKHPIGNQKLTPAQLKKLDEDTVKLLQNYPVYYLTGKCNFYGYDIFVNPTVLIPRPETEELVFWVVTDFKKAQKVSILDVGTGSGCIPITLKKQLQNATVQGIDIDFWGIETAKENANVNECKVDFLKLNFLDESEWDKIGHCDILVSNPPYITRDELDEKSLKAVSNEPQIALFVPENDPLIFYRKCIEFAIKRQNLKYIYFEINEFRKSELLELLTVMGIEKYEFRKDLQQKSRMLKITF